MTAEWRALDFETTVNNCQLEVYEWRGYWYWAVNGIVKGKRRTEAKAKHAAVLYASVSVPHKRGRQQ